MNKDILAYAEATRHDFYKQAFEVINELTKVNESTKIQTQEDAINAVRTSKYIVGSVSQLGNVNFNPSPTVHSDAASARKECKRLATTYPGILFTFAKLAGGELVPTTTISI